MLLNGEYVFLPVFALPFLLPFFVLEAKEATF